MKQLLTRFARPAALAATVGLLGLMGCDKNSQVGILQQPRGSATLRGEATPDQAYDEVFDATLPKLDDSTYLIITRAEHGSLFTVHTGPLPVSDHAVCFASANNPGFRECVQEYYHNAGGVAVQSNEAGWWATPL